MASELLERQSAEPGTLLGREAAAGNLGRALGYIGAGSLFTLAPMAPLRTATLVLLVGAALSLVWWGSALMDEFAPEKQPNTDTGAKRFRVFQ